jgi:hypothetical protein
LVIWGVVRRKKTAVKFAIRPTWRSGSRISPTVFPPPAAPPYMQMSAAVRRNSVCGPSCAAIVKYGGGLYWPDDDPDARDFQKGFDPSTRAKVEMLGEIIHVGKC